MTKKKLIRIISYISIFYIAVFVTGVFFYILDKSPDQKYYSEFKGIFPVIISIPLGYLGSCFQRRASFLTSLRALWANMIHAVNKALLFTEYGPHNDKEFTEVLLLLSKSIDEVRGVYRNIKETKHDKGYYPFESLKTIFTIVESVGKNNATPAQMQEANAQIKIHWQTIRKTFLAEFDRTQPTFTDTVQD